MLRVSCEPFLLQATSVLLILLSYLSETAYGSVHHSTETVHVVLIIDKQSVKSAFTAIHSVSLASTDASRLRFHALVLPSDGFDAKSVLDAAPQCMQRSVNFEVKGWMAPSIYPKFAVSGKGFDNEHIYARFFIPDIFPEIDRYVYIDNDVIVNGDIIDLYSIQLDEILSVMHRREMEAQLMKERANALSRSLDRSRREPDDKGNLPSIQRAVVGFVVEKSYFYKNYVSAHFNLEHPVVKKAMRLLNVSAGFANMRC
jgi:lipopolysaccharide biosynthesis glycosyltransferase